MENDISLLTERGHAIYDCVVYSPYSSLWEIPGDESRALSALVFFSGYGHHLAGPDFELETAIREFARFQRLPNSHEED